MPTSSDEKDSEWLEGIWALKRILDKANVQSTASVASEGWGSECVPGVASPDPQPQTSGRNATPANDSK